MASVRFPIPSTDSDVQNIHVAISDIASIFSTSSCNCSTKIEEIEARLDELETLSVTPTIDELILLDVDDNEIGNNESTTELVVTQITHKETGSSSIISLRIGDNEITPSDVETTVTLNTPISVSNGDTITMIGTYKGGTFNKSITISFNMYAYYNVTSSTVIPTTATKMCDMNTFINDGYSISYKIDDYIYFYTNQPSGTVETYVLNMWAEVDFESLGMVDLTLSSDSTAKYYVYRMGPFISSGQDIYRISGETTDIEISEDNTTTETVDETQYMYYNISSSTTTPTTGTRITNVANFVDSGMKFTYQTNDYIYLYSTFTNATIENSVLNTWTSIESTALGQIDFTTTSGSVVQYYCYRVGPFINNGSDTYRIREVN